MNQPAARGMGTSLRGRALTWGHWGAMEGCGQLWEGWISSGGRTKGERARCCRGTKGAWGMKSQVLQIPQEHCLTFGRLCRSLLSGGFLGSWFGSLFAFGGLFGYCEVKDVHS